MARPLRIKYQDAYYHVTCRGNERKEIFADGHNLPVPFHIHLMEPHGGRLVDLMVDEEQNKALKDLSLHLSKGLGSFVQG